MKLYTKQETIDLFYGKMKNNISNLYKDNCINWSGQTRDTKEFYSEIIAQELLLNLEELNKINIITRKPSYKIDDHDKIMMDFRTSTRDEENFAKRLFDLKFDKLGKIIDYQIPLKNKSKDEVGKIDLISYYDTEEYLYLIELKFGSNKETLLRAILEIYTYFKIIDQAKLISDFGSHKHIANHKNKVKCLPAVMIVSTTNKTDKQCTSFIELNEMKMGERPMLKSLAQKLNIEFFSCELNAVFTNDYLK